MSDTMDIDQALSILTSTSPCTSEALKAATHFLQNTPDTPAIRAFGQVAFDTQRPVASREAAFVLLRSRLLVWKTTPEDVLIRDETEKGISRCLMEAKAYPNLTWRVASVISAVFCSMEDCDETQNAWPRLTTSVIEFLSDLETLKSQERLFCALEIVRALYSDGLPKRLAPPTAIFPIYLLPLFAAALKHDAHMVQKAAVQALGALLESYGLRSSLPSECALLFAQLMELAHHKVASTAREADFDEEVGDLLSVIVSIVDNQTAIRHRQVYIWNQQSLSVLLKLLPMVHAENWRFRNNMLVAPKICQHVCHIVASAVATNPDGLSDQQQEPQEVLVQGWQFLVDHLKLVYSATDLSQVAVEWELTVDDDDYNGAPVNETEVNDFVNETTSVAWEQIDRLLNNIDHQKSHELVFSSARQLFEDFSDNSGYGSRYAGWILLAVWVSSQNEECKLADIEPYLSQWSTIKYRPQNQTIRDLYLSARVRWSILLFTTEVLSNMPNLLCKSQETFKEFVQTLIMECDQERVPRLKAKFALALCQVMSLYDDKEEDDNYNTLATVVQSRFESWLLPLLKDTATGGFTEKACALMVPELRSALDPSLLYGMEMYLKELVVCLVSSCVKFLTPSQTAQYYSVLMSHCLLILKEVPQNDDYNCLAEGILDLSSKTIQHLRQSVEDEKSLQRDQIPLAQQLLQQIRLDSRFIIDHIIQLNRLLEDKEYQRSTFKQHNIKYGIYSQSFDKSLLQAAARLTEGNDDPEITKQLLNIVLSRLQSHSNNPIVTVQDSCQPQKPTSDDITSFIVSNQAEGGKLRTVNINTALIEDQMESFSFINASASNIVRNLTEPEVQQVVKLIVSVCGGSPFRLIWKSGLESLQSLCSAIADQLKKEAQNLLMSAPLDGRNKTESSTYLLSNPKILQDLKHYFIRLRETLAVGVEVVSKCSSESNSEIETIVYTIADAAEGLKLISSMLGSASTILTLIGQQEASQFESIIDNLFSGLLDVLKSSLQKNVDEEEDDDVNAGRKDKADEEEEAFGLRCDSTMQLTSSLAKGFGPLTTEPFERHLKSFFAAILAAENISMVARTAALCVFANHLEAAGNSNSLAAAELLPVALLYCRPEPVNPRIITPFRQFAPQVNAGVKPPETMEEDNLPVLAAAIRQIGISSSTSDSEVVSDCLEPYQPEVMKLQAACYCTGAVCTYSPDLDAVVKHLPAIDEMFWTLLDHPLAGVSARRVILDCLGCAVLKIFRRVPLREACKQPMKIFSGEGLVMILKVLFPLTDDHEDACAAHDLLIDWILEQKCGVLSHLTTDQENGEPSSLPVRSEVGRILKELLSGLPQSEAVLSFPAAFGGRLRAAVDDIQ